MLVDLIKILIDSTCLYTALHISNETNRFAYVRGMSRALNACMEPYHHGDIKRIREAILKLRREVPDRFAPRFEVFSNTKRYYMLGIHQALEVVESIYVRFEKGYSHADEYFVRSILERNKDAS